MHTHWHGIWVEKKGERIAHEDEWGVGQWECEMFHSLKKIALTGSIDRQMAPITTQKQQIF